MPDHEPTVKSRELGEGLRRLLEAARMSGKEVAHHLGWPQSEVSRLLNGKRLIREADVALLLGVCRASAKDQKRLRELCREANKPGWYQQYGSLQPPQVRTYVDHEVKAIAIHAFAATVVPGLLQIEDYSREVITSCANVPADEVGDRVTARLARQEIFSKPRPPRFSFLLHESLLRLPVGGKLVMSDQLHHLLRMSVRPSISLRVVPVSVGAHAGLAGSFILMEFAEIKPVIYLETETTAAFLEEPEEIAAYRRILANLAETALDREQSREMISNLAVELYGSPDRDQR